MGTVFQAADGTWVGRRVIAGKKVQRKGRTQADVLRKLAAAAPATGKATVAEWAAAWRKGLQVRPLTLESYDAVTTHIVATIGTVRLTDLRPSHVEGMAARLQSEGLDGNTVLTVIRILGSMLKAAVRDGLIPANPVTVARKPKRRRPKIDPYTPAELTRIIAAALADPLTRVIAVMAGTGCRGGEAMALTCGDFDPAAGTLSINKTYSNGNLGPPKSAQGVRVIPVPPVLLPALRAAVAGRKPTDPLCPNHHGKRPRQVVRQWRRVVTRAGVPYRNAHQLRHACASAIIAAGVPIPDAARYLGDRPETVLACYAHPSGVDVGAVLGRVLG